MFIDLGRDITSRFVQPNCVCSAMSPENTVISIVIPCYNDGRFLLEAIESVEGIQQGPREIIVVNDGSTDRTTLEVLSSVEQRGLQVIHLVNGGPGRARNRGVSAAKGRYILPLDADNRLRPAAIDRAIQILDRDPGIDVLYGDVEFFDGKSGRECVPEFDLRRLLVWNYIYASSLFRKSSWEHYGGFDEDRATQGFEDWDFWCRIACGGGKLRHAGEILHEYRVRNDSFGMEVSAQRCRTEAILRHIRAKKVEVTMGQYHDAFQSWEPVIEQCRKRPIKTLASLVMRSYFPKAYSKRLARDGKA
jgi:glycosyltransferase involved in cell wall biosynthesis